MFLPFQKLGKSRRIVDEDIYPNIGDTRKKVLGVLKNFLAEANVRKYSIKDQEEKIFRSNDKGIRNAIFAYKILSPEFVEPYRMFAAIRIRDGEMEPDENLYVQIPDGRVYKETAKRVAATRVKAVTVENKRLSILEKFRKKRKAQEELEPKVLPPAFETKKQTPKEVTPYKDVQRRDPKVTELVSKLQIVKTTMLSVANIISDLKSSIDERFRGQTEDLKRQESEILSAIINNKDIVEKVCYDLGENSAVLDRASITKKTLTPSSDILLAEVVKKFDIDGEIGRYIEELGKAMTRVQPYMRERVVVFPKTKEQRISQMQDSPLDDLLTIRSVLEALAVSLGKVNVQMEGLIKEIEYQEVPTAPLMEERPQEYEYAYAKKVAQLWSLGFVDDKKALEFFEDEEDKEKK